MKLNLNPTAFVEFFLCSFFCSLTIEVQLTSNQSKQTLCYCSESATCSVSLSGLASLPFFVPSSQCAIESDSSLSLCVMEFYLCDRLDKVTQRRRMWWSEQIRSVFKGSRSVHGSDPRGSKDPDPLSSLWSDWWFQALFSLGRQVVKKIL